MVPSANPQSVLRTSESIASPKSANNKVHLLRRLVRLETLISLDAAAVRCNFWFGVTAHFLLVTEHLRPGVLVGHLDFGYRRLDVPTAPAGKRKGDFRPG